MPISSKQRAQLRGMAMELDTIIQVGKGGMGDNLVADISAALDAHELVKVTVLKTAGVSASEVLAELAERLGAEQVCATGNKVVLYRRSEKDGVRHIEFGAASTRS